MELYTLQGTGDREHKVLEETQFFQRVSSGDGDSWFTTCLGTTNTRWETAIYASFNQNPFTPYPGWGSVYTLPCAA